MNNLFVTDLKNLYHNLHRHFLMFCLLIASLTFLVSDIDAATSTMQFSGKTYTVESGSDGYFPRVNGVPVGGTVNIQVYYPEGKAGDKIVVSPEDGGKVNGQLVVVLNLNANKRISFQFTANEQQGLYTILLKRDSDIAVAQLWVGP